MHFNGTNIKKEHMIYAREDIMLGTRFLLKMNQLALVLTE